MTPVFTYTLCSPRIGRPVALKYAVTWRRSSRWNADAGAYLTRSPPRSGGVRTLEHNALMIHDLALEAALVVVAAHELHPVAEISIHEQPGKKSRHDKPFSPGEP